MRPITLRNLPPAVARAVRDRAGAEGLSLNKAVLRILEEALGLSRTKRPPINRDFEDFIGVWTDEEAREIERRIYEQRRVDPELWR
ncbi:MAG: hypothetical protein HY293_13955 [Planctomycetes bacterium]|nr:hypothetical protein [Planctomycetota bacterium]